MDAATAYILRHFEDISRLSEEYLKLNFEEVKEVMSDDRLNVHAEESVCEAIFRYVCDCSILNSNSLTDYGKKNQPNNLAALST